MKTYIWAVFATVSLLLSCNGQPPENVQTVSPKAFAQRMQENPDAQLLDVRTAEEFNANHLDNAKNIDWYDQENFDKQVVKLDKTKPVFVYCMAGSRSRKAAAKLHSAGFTSVYDLDGGIMKWDSENTKTTSGTIGMKSQDFFTQVRSGNVLVDLYAPWCEPCKKMAPYLAKMEKEDASVKILRLNADEHKSLVKELKVASLPTLLLYIDGAQTWKHEGFISEQDLKKQIQ